MSEPESLQAEVERLRTEVEAYRQRELADLRAALTQCREERENYRLEAYRNAEAGRQISSGLNETITKLRSQLETRELLSNGRIGRNGQP